MRMEIIINHQRELVNLLVNIVAKGGNLALNISPQPDGRIPVEAWESLRGLGVWMQMYGEAIYGTTDLCAVPEQKPGIYAKRRCRLCDSAVSGGKGSSRRETFDSLSGENPRDFHGRYEERG